MISNLNQKEENNTNSCLGLPADFLMSISSFSVLFLFFLPDISLLFYYVSLLILISLWYVYYVCTLQLC